MAFATSNVRLESIGSLFRMVGDFTSNVGDADGTVAVGGKVYDKVFNDFSDTTPTTQPLPSKVSRNSTTGISTVTVNVSNGVTAGTFIIDYR